MEVTDGSSESAEGRSDDAHVHVRVLGGSAIHRGDEIDGHLLDVVDAVGLSGTDTSDVDHRVVTLGDSSRRTGWVVSPRRPWSSWESRIC